MGRAEGLGLNYHARDFKRGPANAPVFILAGHFGIGRAMAAVLWNLYATQRPISDWRLAIMSGVTSVKALEVHISRLRQVMPIAYRENGRYCLSADGRETVRTVLWAATRELSALTASAA